MLTFFRTKIWIFEWLFSEFWWMKLEMNRRSKHLFPFPLFPDHFKSHFTNFPNDCRWIFQSSSIHLLLFTPRHAKSQLKLIQPQKTGRGSALSRRLSFSLQAPADSADSILKPVQNKRNNLRKWEKIFDRQLNLRRRLCWMIQPGSKSQSWKR